MWRFEYIVAVDRGDNLVIITAGPAILKALGAVPMHIRKTQSLKLREAVSSDSIYATDHTVEDG